MIYQETFTDTRFRTKIIEKNDFEFPSMLTKIQNSPKKLYAKGNLDILNKTAIAIIGSRNCTQYGEKIAEQFAYELAKQDICIISGMAIGIDANAHKGCLRAGGSTIAVIGSGFSHIYPRQNKQLYQEILRKKGLVLTEYSPEIVPNSAYFPERNRIVSGLSIGVLVVEAEYRSGTSITARMARQQGKTVFCIPNSIHEKHAIGTNQLLKTGAILVTCPDDILEYLGIPKNKTDKTIQTTIIEHKIAKSYQKVYQKVLNQPIHINQIIRSTKQTTGEVMGILTMLEIEGHVKQLPGNYFVRC